MKSFTPTPYIFYAPAARDAIQTSLSPLIFLFVMLITPLKLWYEYWLIKILLVPWEVCNIST